MIIELSNTRSSHDRLMKSLDDYTGECNLADKPGHRLRLCLDELFTNVISYGFDEGVEGHISIEIEVNGSDINVVMRDNGNPFNPFDDTHTPDTDADIDDRDLGGLGVFFVASIAREHGYARENGQNIVRLVLDNE